MSWLEAVENLGLMVERRLSDDLLRLASDSTSYHRFVGELYKKVCEYVLRRGKRLAAVAALIVYEGYRGMVDESILKVCSGLELYRHYILIHDDLVDGEEFRRGGMAFHNLFKEYGYDERLGEGVAVFTGSIVYALAIRAILSSGFEEGKVHRAMRILNECCIDVNESQILDLLFEYKDVDVDEWYVMASKRAASLFRAAILVGAVLADAPEKDIPIISEAAVNIGYAFDIQDDIIDTFASRDQYGREPGGDLVRGKKPLHIVYTLKMGGVKAAKLLRGVRSKGRVSDGELKSVRGLIMRCGALDAAKMRAELHIEKATRLIGKTSMSERSKDFFRSLLSFIKESMEWYR